MERSSQSWTRLLNMSETSEVGTQSKHPQRLRHEVFILGFGSVIQCKTTDAAWDELWALGNPFLGISKTSQVAIQEGTWAHCGQASFWKQTITKSQNGSKWPEMADQLDLTPQFGSKDFRLISTLYDCIYVSLVTAGVWRLQPWETKVRSATMGPERNVFLRPFHNCHWNIYWNPLRLNRLIQGLWGKVKTIRFVLGMDIGLLGFWWFWRSPSLKIHFFHSASQTVRRSAGVTRHQSRVCSSKIFSGMPWPSRKLHTCQCRLQLVQGPGDPPLPREVGPGPLDVPGFFRSPGTPGCLVAEMIAAVGEQVVGVKAGVSLLCRSGSMLLATCLEQQKLKQPGRKLSSHVNLAQVSN